MTSVYSGGLVYEYSEEGNNYGLVTINSPTSVTEGPDFLALQAALKAQADPPGTGGYNATGGQSGCPAQSSTWNVTSDALPAIPSGAAAFMKSGAGKGAGLTGAGSQDAGGTSTGTATPGSGSVTAVATSSGTATGKSDAATMGPMDRSPMIFGLIAASFTILGATLL
jgi:1,3-beta-glucanosyltransferase GAS5